MAAKRYCVADPEAALIDRLILEQVTQNSRVLDLGCGDGRLLCRLRDERNCSIQGIELDHSRVVEAIHKGVPVLQADLDEGLGEVPDASFDFAVLSQTLQQVLKPQDLLLQMLRVARKILVVVPNFGHWRVRLQILLQGRAPMTTALPYDWYNTPNLHFLSMLDFRDLVEETKLRIVREIPVIRGNPSPNAWAANLRADSALFVLEQA
ncbi:MAG TPA: methionine biosynthesis protein MetW [Planctomycetaceae bacterium]|nr:methionine biosynthesis protein MetW [Planctomycetaceae bacterium]